MKRTRKDHTRNFLFAAVSLFVIGGIFLAFTLIQNHKPIRGLASQPGPAKNFEEELMRKIQVANLEGESSVRFDLLSESGKKICSKYDLVTIQFAAEGMSISGDRPLVELELDCKVVKDQEYVEFRVPNQQLSKRKPSSLAIHDKGTSVSFHHVSWVWPDAWVLSAVNYESKKGDRAPIKPKYVSDIKRIQW